MFLEHKNKYDKNIILGSLPARLYAPNLTWHHVNNSIIDFSNTWINHGLSKEEVNDIHSKCQIMIKLLK